MCSFSYCTAVVILFYCCLFASGELCCDRLTKEQWMMRFELPTLSDWMTCICSERETALLVDRAGNACVPTDFVYRILLDFSGPFI